MRITGNQIWSKQPLNFCSGPWHVMPHDIARGCHKAVWCTAATISLRLIVDSLQHHLKALSNFFWDRLANYKPFREKEANLIISGKFT